MSSILSSLKLPKFTIKLPSALAKAGRTMSECPLELSFSLCDDSPILKNKTEEEIPLQVKLPLDSASEKILLIDSDALEKAEEETNEKQDNMEVTCSVSVDGQDKQEFSFTLYDFDTCEKVNKQDIEKVVVRSICEALNKTLKLPPSGSRTIKVKLAISPDSSTSKDNEPLPPNEPEWTLPNSEPLPRLNDCCSAQSGNTASTYLPSCHSNEKSLRYASPQALRQTKTGNDVRAMPSPKLKTRQCRGKLDLKSHLRERLNLRVNASDNRHHHDNLSQNLNDSQLSKQPSNRDHLPECRDRRNHYLDLAGIESPKCNDLSQPDRVQKTATTSDPKYLCPYRLLDRTHNCSKPHRVHSSSPLKKPSYHTKMNLEETASPKPSPRLFRTKMNLDPQDDLLNLNYDLCDLVPEAKFDWEKPHHRRSKSYDLYENEVTNFAGFYSPKLKPKNPNWASILESQKLSNQMPSSPGHQYRHRHRDRERQRAMQQVASWIAREHSSSKLDTAKQFVRASLSPSAIRKHVAEKHEHHHLHEHVHHHYHHFVEF